MSLARGLSILFTFSKNQLLVLLSFFYCFFEFYFIDFFFDLLPSADLRFSVVVVLLFLVNLGAGLGCRYDIFLLF